MEFHRETGSSRGVDRRGCGAKLISELGWGEVGEIGGVDYGDPSLDYGAGMRAFPS